MDAEVLDEIQAHAQRILELAGSRFRAEVGYDERGVRWLDAYIEQIRGDLDPEDYEAVTPALGSFLGACVIQTYGGVWGEADDQICVRIGEKGAVFVFGRVLRQLQQGSAASVHSLFRALSPLFGETVAAKRG